MITASLSKETIVPISGDDRSASSPSKRPRDARHSPASSDSSQSKSREACKHHCPRLGFRNRHGIAEAETVSGTARREKERNVDQLRTRALEAEIDRMVEEKHFGAAQRRFKG